MPLNLDLLTCPNSVPLKNREGRQLWRHHPIRVPVRRVRKTLIVPDGFVTDLASIPRLPFVYRELEDIADTTGVPHDFAYSTGFLDRDTANLMLKEACLLIGISSWKVWAIYSGVRVGASSLHEDLRSSFATNPAHRFINLYISLNSPLCPKWLSMSPEYIKEKAILDREIRECISVSQRCAGIPSETGAHFYASVLFTLLCTKSVSLGILVPNSSWAKKKKEHWDFSSIAGLVRSILETRLAFFYLGYEKCSIEEWECRWNLLNLHDSVSRIRFFENIPSELHDQVNFVANTDGFHGQVTELHEKLNTNPFFMSFSLKQRNILLKGAHAYLSSLEDIAVRSGVDIHSFRWLYQILSAQIHTLPLAFNRMKDQNRGRGIHSEVEEKYITLVVTFSAGLLLAAKDEMKQLFPSRFPQLMKAKLR
jgi:hypothetical protein